MGENDVLASLPSVTMRSSEHLAWKGLMTNYITTANFLYRLHKKKFYIYILGLNVITQK